MFTLTDTGTNKETKADTTATVPNGIGVLVKDEHLHSIIFKPFLSVSVLALVSVSVNAPLGTYHLKLTRLFQFEYSQK